MIGRSQAAAYLEGKLPADGGNEGAVIRTPEIRQIIAMLRKEKNRVRRPR